MTQIDLPPVTAGKPALKSRIILAMILGLLALGVWGKITHNGLFESVGFLPLLLALLVFMIRRDLRARRDPQFARQAAAERSKYLSAAKANRWKNFRGHLIGALVGMAIVVALHAAKWFAPAMSKLSSTDQVIYGGLAGITLIVLGNLAWMAWKRRRVSAKP